MYESAAAAAAVAAAAGGTSSWDLFAFLWKDDQVGSAERKLVTTAMIDSEMMMINVVEVIAGANEPGRENERVSDIMK